MCRSIMENFELMGRTVQYLDADGVALEHARRISADGLSSDEWANPDAKQAVAQGSADRSPESQPEGGGGETSKTPHDVLPSDHSQEGT